MKAFIILGLIFVVLYFIVTWVADYAKWHLSGRHRKKRRRRKRQSSKKKRKRRPRAEEDFYSDSDDGSSSEDSYDYDE